MDITAKELAAMLQAEVVGNDDLVLHGVAKIEDATEAEVSFVANPAYKKYLDTCEAGAVIVSEVPEAKRATYLVTEDPYRAFLAALNYFHPAVPRPHTGVHPSAVVGENVTLGKDVVIGPNCVVEDGVVIGDNTIIRAMVFIGRNTKIGNDCFFHSRVSVRENCVVGNRVILQDGAVIGSDGFGFAPGQEGYAKIPQVGNVVLEDDVEIGANATIDRATMGKTIIHRGVKLDNLVQIAHNVEVGEDTVMAAQVGVAGSAKVGKRSMFGGQVGVAGHIRLSDQVIVAAQSGVHKDPGEGKIVGGYPAREIRVWQRLEAALGHLPDLLKRVRQLEKKD